IQAARSHPFPPSLLWCVVERTGRNGSLSFSYFLKKDWKGQKKKKKKEKEQSPSPLGWRNECINRKGSLEERSRRS
ncbi:unnamed protein product, partial [Musa acuminata subsp. burmannicoides]